MLGNVTAALLAAALAGGPSKSATSDGQIRFELVTVAQGLDAQGKPDAMAVDRCLYGRYAPGVRVLLLSEKDSTTCQGVTGRVGNHILNEGECTVLLGAKGCDEAHSLGVIGARGAYRRLEPKPVTDAATLEALEAAIVQGKVVEAATERWKAPLESLSFDKTIVDALSWPGLAGAPTLVRLKVNGDPTGGPWVAIYGGKAGAIVGPFTWRAPIGFTLDGRSYLRIEIAGCTKCGAVGTEVHLVEGGQLRQVASSHANSN